MSEQMKWAQRWNINDDGEMVMSDSGSWVENAYYEYLKAENASLKAEVERLRKAGDKLVEVIQDMDVIIDMDSNHPEVSEWADAKEGKQS